MLKSAKHSHQSPLTSPSNAHNVRAKLSIVSLSSQVPHKENKESIKSLALNYPKLTQSAPLARAGFFASLCLLPLSLLADTESTLLDTPPAVKSK